MDTDSLESILVGVKAQRHQQDPRKPRPQPEQSLKCPRCDSPNTKFCYYNNYSLSQPRYICKSCRRYWTKGGTLRNIPVGGGCRKKNRVSSTKRKHDLHFEELVNSLDKNDLALPFASFQNQDPTDNNNNNNNGPRHFGSDVHVLDMGEYNVGNDIGIPSLGLLDSITRGLFENGSTNPGGNFYSGEGDYDHVAAMKRELFTGEDVMLLGFPWQVNVNGNGINGSLSPSSSALVSWNGGLNSSSRHHGLINTTN